MLSAFAGRPGRALAVLGLLLCRDLAPGAGGGKSADTGRISGLGIVPYLPLSGRWGRTGGVESSWGCNNMAEAKPGALRGVLGHSVNAVFSPLLSDRGLIDARSGGMKAIRRCVFGQGAVHYFTIYPGLIPHRPRGFLGCRAEFQWNSIGIRVEVAGRSTGSTARAPGTWRAARQGARLKAPDARSASHRDRHSPLRTARNKWL